MPEKLTNVIKNSAGHSLLGQKKVVSQYVQIIVLINNSRITLPFKNSMTICSFSNTSESFYSFFKVLVILRARLKCSILVWGTVPPYIAESEIVEVVSFSSTVQQTTNALFNNIPIV